MNDYNKEVANMYWILRHTGFTKLSYNIAYYIQGSNLDKIKKGHLYIDKLAGTILITDEKLQVSFKNPVSTELERLLPEDVVINYDKNKNIESVELLNNEFSLLILDSIASILTKEYFNSIPTIKELLATKPRIDMKEFEKEYGIRNENKIKREIRLFYT